jgi:Rrf2 family transcriptional regulator, cysteine metabolism repressor
MPQISKKCQYALRTLYELASRDGNQPVPVGEIAEAQAIPHRFLELIVSDLRRAGIVLSRRGMKGGYMLASSPDELTVGEVIRLIDGPLTPVDCVACGGDSECPLGKGCAFQGLWKQSLDAMAGVYDTTSFADLVEQNAPKGATQHSEGV